MTVIADVVGTITAHHAELEAEVSARTAAVVDAARAGRPHEQAVAALRELLAHDVVPHARAEEEVLYAAATSPTVTRLVEGMVFEHETLLALVTELDAVSDPVDAAAIARAIREIFVGHVRRENDLLLPVLATDPAVDLPALLPRMHERFTTYRS